MKSSLFGTLLGVIHPKIGVRLFRTVGEEVGAKWGGETVTGHMCLKSLDHLHPSPRILWLCVDNLLRYFKLVQKRILKQEGIEQYQ